jgi:hypothetical protein
MNWTSDQQGPGHPAFQKIPSNFSILTAHPINYGGPAVAAFSARRQDLPFVACKWALVRLPAGNTAYIKERLFSRFSIERSRFPENRCLPDRESTSCRGDRMNDRNHAQQSGS